jgi:ribonuclease HI
MSESLPQVIIYTDGGADPNPGPGGWGAVLIFDHPEKGRIEKALSGGKAETTNNQMELTAALEALRALKSRCQVKLYTDSEYLKKGITQWIINWRAKNWQQVANKELWQALDEVTQNHTITWHWVRGHTGNTYNERAHQLASAAIPRPKNPLDPHLTQVYLRISGSEDGRAGPSGWAAAIQRGDQTEILSGGHPSITPNHFALDAIIQVLEQLPPTEVLQIVTNNGYLYDGITKWVKGWRESGWIRPEKFAADWQKLDALNRARTLRWFKMVGEPEAYKSLKKVAESARQRFKAP